jgi:hypothetical protein
MVFCNAKREVLMAVRLVSLSSFLTVTGGAGVGWTTDPGTGKNRAGAVGCLSKVWIGGAGGMTAVLTVTGEVADNRNSAAAWMSSTSYGSS